LSAAVARQQSTPTILAIIAAPGHGVMANAIADSV